MTLINQRPHWGGGEGAASVGRRTSGHGEGPQQSRQFVDEMSVRCVEF
jgi:hypothetical protein